MNGTIDTICPQCGWSFTLAEEDWDESILCPECEWSFGIDEDGFVTDEDPERENEPIWEVDAEGELCEEETVTRRCRHCGAVVGLPEVGAVAVRCERCRRTVPVELLWTEEGRPRDTEDYWWEEYGEYEEEERDPIRCPACGFEESEGGQVEHEVIATTSTGTLVGCFACGWRFEVSEHLAPYNDEEADFDEEEEEEPPAPFVVSPCGRHDCTTIAEAIRRAGPGTHVIVRPGLYEEQLTLWNPIEIIADGPPGEVILASERGTALQMRAEHARVRGLTIRELSHLHGTQANAIEVHKGRLALEDCRITAGAGVCVASRGWAEVVLRRCTIHDGEEGGVQIAGRGGTRLEDCTIEGNVGPGIHVEEGVLTMRNCRIFQGRAEGVRIASARQVTLEDCKVTDNGGAGLVVQAGRSVLHRCQVFANEAQGVRVERRGVCALEECALSANAESAVGVARGSKAVLRRCRIHSGRGAGVLVRGQALLAGCQIHGNAGPGAVVADGQLSLVDCDLRGGRAEGVLATGHMELRATGCRVIAHAGPNVAIRATGAWKLRGCDIHDGRNVGLVVRGKALGLMEHCEVVGNAHAGVVLGGGTSTTLRRCMIGDQARLSGVVIQDGASGRLERCVIVGNRLAGVEARRGGRAHLLQCQVHRNGAAGVWAHTRAAVLIEEGALSQNGGTDLEIEPGSHCL